MFVFLLKKLGRWTCFLGNRCDNKPEERRRHSAKEMMVLEKYAKIVLYTYPLLATVEEDYIEHIKNRAILSYRDRNSALQLAEYLAREIVEKRNLEWLKSTIKKVVGQLSDVERALTEARYFKRKSIQQKAVLLEKAQGRLGSRSQYFRLQSRLGDKLGAMLQSAGLTKEVYESTFAGMEIFRWAKRLVERKEEKDYPSVSSVS